MKDILIVIPAYNEEKTIGNIVKKLRKKCNILVINDGSSDRTAKIAKKNGAKVIDLYKNFGVDYSINQGFKFAKKNKYKYVVTIDADGQHSLNDLNKIIAILKKNKNIDLIISQRSNFPRLSEKLFSLYTISRFGVKDLLSGLKAYKIEIYSQYGYYDTFKSIGTELSSYAIENNFNFKTIKINVLDRKDNSRIGGKIVGNFKILKALIGLIFKKFK